MRHEGLRVALQQAALTAEGDTDLQLRSAVQDAVVGLVRGSRQDLEVLDEVLQSYVEAVALHADEITDGQVDGLRAAGLTDAAIYELTVTAAVAAGLERVAIAEEVWTPCG